MEPDRRYPGRSLRRRGTLPAADEVHIDTQIEVHFGLQRGTREPGRWDRFADIWDWGHSAIPESIRMSPKTDFGGRGRDRQGSCDRSRSMEMQCIGSLRLRTVAAGLRGMSSDSDLGGRE